MVRLPLRKLLFWEEARQEREKPRIWPTALFLERLDDRVLPAVTADLWAGILSITADDVGNQVRLIQASQDQVEVREGNNLVGAFATGDVQLAVFRHGAGTDTFTNQTTIRDKELRLFDSGPLTPAQLSQTGSFDALLVNNTLSLTGPSGAGFQIQGVWNTLTEQVGDLWQHRFSGQGIMLLQTAAGPIPFTAGIGSPLVITTVPSTMQVTTGVVDQVDWQSDWLTTEGTLQWFRDKFGIEIDADTVQLGIRLGQNLSSFQMPVNNAIPYITATATYYSARYGDLTAQSGAGNPLTALVDPQDVALYARVQEYTVGASQKGYIPFSPLHTIEDLVQNPLYGHLYGRGPIQVGDSPVTIQAETVMNLDANRDGQLLQGLSGNMMQRVTSGQTSLATLGQIARQDLRVGLNGQTQIGFRAAGHDMTLAASATAVYGQGRLQAHGVAQLTVFTNTVLNFVNPTVNVDVVADLREQGYYDIVATASAANVAGFTAADLRVALNNSGITAEARLAQMPGFGQIYVRGTVAASGSYELLAAANVNLAGFAVVNGYVVITNQNILYGGDLEVPNVARVAVAGLVDRQGQFVLYGTANVNLGGFALADAVFYLTNDYLAALAHLSVPNVVEVDLLGIVGSDGQMVLGGTADVTVAGFPIRNASFGLTNTLLAVAATVVVPNVATVDMTGTLTRTGDFSLYATGNVQVAGFAVENATLYLTNTLFYVAARVRVPNVAQVDVEGMFTSTGQVNLTGTATFTVAGFPLTNATFYLTETTLYVLAQLNISGIGQLNLSGMVNTQGQFSLTAQIPSVNIAFVTLTNVQATLNNTSLTVQGRASNLPLIGTVDFVAAVTPQGFTFRVTLPQVTVLGFNLGAVNAALDTNGLTVSAQGLSLPVVGNVTFTGQIQASSFSLAATAQNVTVAGFITFSTVALTLTPTSLSLSGTTSVPVVGTVTFTGALAASGTFTISATAPQFTVLGFVTFTNATVSLRFPNPTLTVSARTTLAGIGQVDFSGSISQNGFSFTANAQLIVAGFTLGNANMRISNDSQVGDAIQIGPFTTPPLPVIGPVTFSGTYASGGQFSFRATIGGPIVIAGIPFRDLTIGLSNTSLTLGAGIGLVFGGLDIGRAYFEGTIWTNGNYRFTAEVSAFRVLGFSAVQGQLVLTPQDLRLTANANLVFATASLTGFVIFATGQYELIGNANITIASFVLSNTRFTLNNAGAAIYSRTNVVGVGSVDFNGFITSTGTFSATARANITVAGFPLVNANLDLNNSRLAISVTTTIAGLGTAALAGTLTSTGNFDLTARANIAPAGFSIANADLRLTNTRLDVAGNYAFPGLVTVRFVGVFQSNGQFSLTASAQVGLAGFAAVTGNFTLNNSGARLAANVNVVVAVVSFNGTLQSNGNYSLTGSASVSLGGYSAVTGAFTLTNAGASVQASLNVVVATVSFQGTITTAGTYSLTGTASVSLGGYSAVTGTFTLTPSGVSVRASINVVVATVSFQGAVSRTGTYSLTGSAGVSLGGFASATGSFTMTATALTVSAAVNVRVATVTFSGTVSRTGTYSMSTTANANFAGFVWSTTFTLTQASGVAIRTTMGFTVMGWRGTFNGRVNTNGTFSFTLGTRIDFGSLDVNLSVTLANTGFTAQVSAVADVTAQVNFLAWSLRVGFRGSFNVGATINTNGTFSASGNMSMCGYLGVSVCAGIGFGFNRSEIWVNTNDIGFSVWSVGFHPFGRLRFTY